MRVLVACEFSGVVREAFRKKGHDAYSCDLLPALDKSPYHFQTDIRHLLKGNTFQGDDYTRFLAFNKNWDLIIAHPPCTYLTVAANKHYADKPELYLPAVEFATTFFDYADRVCVENPVGRLSSHFRKPDQIIQPYEFGDDASKKTCLWLKGLPVLSKNPDNRCPGRLVEYPPNSGRMVERWSNQTDSGQNRLGPSPARASLRSITYQGIAQAMADQWG